MFDGKVKSSRTVSFKSTSGAKRESSAQDLVDNVRKQRELRQITKHRNNAAIKIQSTVRLMLCRKRVLSLFQQEFDKKVGDITKLKTLFLSKNSNFFIPVDILLGLYRLFFFFYNPKRDTDRTRKMQQYFYESIANSSTKHNLIYQLLKPSHYNQWKLYVKLVISTMLPNDNEGVNGSESAKDTANSSMNHNNLLKTTMTILFVNPIKLNELSDVQERELLSLPMVLDDIAHSLCGVICKHARKLTLQNTLSNDPAFVSIFITVIQRCIKRMNMNMIDQITSVQNIQARNELVSTLKNYCRPRVNKSLIASCC
jgi:hypothetical protein